MVDHMYGSRIRALATPWNSKEWLLANFCDYTSPNVWPLKYPDLSPMDYYVWGQSLCQYYKSTVNQQNLGSFSYPSQGKCNISLLQVPGPD